MRLVIYYQLLLLLLSPHLVQFVEGWTRTARAHEQDSSQKGHSRESSSSSSASTPSSHDKKERAVSTIEKSRKASTVPPSSSSLKLPSISARTQSEGVEDIVVNKKQLIDFFNSTYISKIQAKIDKKTKKAFAGFYGWGIYHLHHVCIEGGSDGIVVGIEGIDNDHIGTMNAEELKAYNKQKKKSFVSFSEWMAYTKKYNLPIRPKKFNPMARLEQSNDKILVTYKHGNTMYLNCFHQVKESANPAHWMMKLGPLYEIAMWKWANPKEILSAHINNNSATPFDHIQFHQCPSPALTGWKWGLSIEEITKHRSDLANVTDQYTLYSDVGYQRVSEAATAPLLCYDDLYAITRQGVWFRGREPLVMFRRDAKELYGVPRDSYEPLELNAQGYDVTPQSVVSLQRHAFCKNYKPLRNGSDIYGIPDGKSEARIKIFQRTATKMLRKFVNMDEVIKLVQEYTLLPVEIVTVNDATSIVDQIKVFNSFDILITSHGSQLANGIFTAYPETKTVIEIDTFAFDRVFYTNYVNQLGFAEYLISTGHLTSGNFANGEKEGKQCPFPDYNSFEKLGCVWKPLAQNVFKGHPRKTEQVWLTCGSEYQTRPCDTLVNITTLRQNMNAVFQQLCKESDIEQLAK